MKAAGDPGPKTNLRCRNCSLRSSLAKSNGRHLSLQWYVKNRWARQPLGRSRWPRSCGRRWHTREAGAGRRRAGPYYCQSKISNPGSSLSSWNQIAMKATDDTSISTTGGLAVWFSSTRFITLVRSMARWGK